MTMRDVPNEYDEVARGLTLAREHCEEHWAADSTSGPGIATPGSCCTWTALAAVGMRARRMDLAEQALLDALEVEKHPEGKWMAQSIWNWNDKEGRTKEQVLEAYDKAIAATREFADQVRLGHYD